MASPLGTQRCVTAFFESDFRPDLAKFTVPTLVIHGDGDHVVPIDKSGKRVPDHVKGARLEVVGGAPHGLLATHAADVNTLLLDFIRG